MLSNLEEFEPFVNQKPCFRQPNRRQIERLPANVMGAINWSTLPLANLLPTHLQLFDSAPCSYPVRAMLYEQHLLNPFKVLADTDVVNMNKTTTRLVSLGGIAVLGACAIALAQHDSRNRERTAPRAVNADAQEQQPIQASPGWRNPFDRGAVATSGQQYSSAYPQLPAQPSEQELAGQDNGSTGFRFSDNDNPLRDALPGDMAIPSSPTASQAALLPDDAHQELPTLTDYASQLSNPSETTDPVHYASGATPSTPQDRTYSGTLPPVGTPALPSTTMPAPGVRPPTASSRLGDLGGTPNNAPPPSLPSTTPTNTLSSRPGTTAADMPPSLPALPSSNGAAANLPPAGIPTSTVTIPTGPGTSAAGLATGNALSNASTGVGTALPENRATQTNIGIPNVGLPTSPSPAASSLSNGAAANQAPNALSAQPQITTGPTISDTQRGAMPATDLTQTNANPFPQTRLGTPAAAGNAATTPPTNNSPMSRSPYGAPPIGESQSNSVASGPATRMPPGQLATGAASAPNTQNTAQLPTHRSNIGANSAGVPGSLLSLVSNQPGDRYLDGSQSPVLQIQKRAPAEIQVGKKASFVITVRNEGNATAHNVSVVDRVPRGAQFAASVPQIKPDSNGVLVWNIGEVPAGEERTIQIQLIPEIQGEIGSVATVHFAAQASVRTVATLPKLVIELLSTPDVLVGDQQEIQVVVRNEGTGVAKAVRLEADLPNQLRHESGDMKLEAVVGDMRPNETRQMTLLTAAVQPGQSAAQVRAIAEDGISAQDTVNVHVLSPNLVAALKGPAMRYLERQATYQVAVLNDGTASANDLDFQIHLPTGLRFNACDVNGQYNPQSHSIVWRLTELPAGQTAPMEFTVLPVELGSQVINFSATGDLNVAAEAKAEVNVQGLSELAFTVGQTDSTIEVGAVATYSIQISNVGNKADTNVQLAIDLPPGAQDVSVISAPVEYRTAGNQIIFAPIAELRSKDQVTYQFQVTHSQPGKQIVRSKLVSHDWPTPVTKDGSTLVYDDRN